ncbi:MAG: amidase [Myxococcota bacterium]
MSALHEQGVRELATRVAAREVPARALVDHQLARIEAHDGGLGCFVHLDAAGARARADALDAALARGEPAGPLAGVPFGVKVLEDVTGWPHTLAARVFADRVATTTSTQVTRLLAAGAIPLGLTASPEMGAASFTASELYGVCRNPWDPARTPGGSSGGSAAAVAAGLVPFATGSDSGGSLRIPAAYSGVFGFKGTYGRVPRGPGYVGMPNLRNYGALVREVRDAARLLDCVVGADEHDPLSLPKPAVAFERAVDEEPLAGLRVAWTSDLGFARCDPDVAARVRRAAAQLVAAAGFEERDVPVVLPDPESAWRVLGAPDVLGLYGPFLEERADEVNPFMRAIARAGADMSAADFSRAALERDALVQALARVFDDVDLLLLPTVATPAFAAEGPPPAEIDGAPVSMLASVALTYVFNLSGHPAASLPIPDPGAAPLGLQIVGRRHDDARVLAAAARFEAEAPWPRLASGFA